MVTVPARLVHGNRIWTRDGAIWAGWRLGLPDGAFASLEQRLAVHARVRRLLAALPPEAQVLGISRRLPPAEVAARVRRGVPTAARRRWRAASDGDVASLLRARPAERRVYLFVRLAEPTPVRVLDAVLAAAGGRLRVPAPPPPADEVRRARALADDQGSRLAQGVQMHPVDAAELRWLYRRSVGRHRSAPSPTTGDPGRPAGPQPARGAPSSPDRPQSIAADLFDAVLHEGGRAGDPGRGRHRRYLRVDADGRSTYQGGLVIAEMPHAFHHPGGGEWFAAADLVGFEVDWWMRVTSVTNGDAQQRAKRQQRQLAAQLEEYDGEPAGLPPSLSAALEGSAHEQQSLAANPSDPELEVAMGFTLGGRDVQQLDARCRQLGDVLAPAGFTLQRPTGGQVGLFTAALPVAAAPPVCGDYTQYLLPRDLAAGTPLLGSAIGDPQGVPLGLTAGTGRPDVVLIDPAHGPRTNRSGSLGVFGALGSGKSFFVKRLLLGAVARGGRVVTLDRTAAGEYAQLHPVVAGSSRVVALHESAALGLDPLRVFPGQEGVSAAVGFLTLLTGSAATDLDGAALVHAVRDVAAAGGALADVPDALLAADDPEAAIVRRKLLANQQHPLSGLVFGDHPPLQLDADYICFHAPGLSLPDRSVLQAPHLARQLLPEQVFAQALLYLVAAVARHIVFADADRFGAVLIDEAWALTGSPQGRQLLLDTVRDGRKHAAAVWLLSQHPDDLGDDALAHLLGMRVLFRQARGAAPSALRFLGVDGGEDMVDLVVDGLQTGQCLMRDVGDTVGLVQILPPSDPAVAAAIDTTPGPA